MTVLHEVEISLHNVLLDGQPVETNAQGFEKIMELYQTLKVDYPKFYKMDELCKLAFISAELLLSAENPRLFNTENRAIILFNRASSFATDSKFQTTISDIDNFFPSPALFVYTLPNITTGEIAIRNKYFGESSFYVLERENADQMREIIETAFLDDKTESVLAGWVDFVDKNNFLAKLKLIKK